MDSSKRGNVKKRVYNKIFSDLCSKVSSRYILTSAVIISLIIGFLYFGGAYDNINSSMNGGIVSSISNNIRSVDSSSISSSSNSDKVVNPQVKMSIMTKNNRRGDVLIEIHKEWAPIGSNRFIELVNSHFYDDNRFFRVISGFMSQFGINGTPSVQEVWQHNTILDDPSIKGISNTRGMISFAMSGKNSRTSQIFINYNDNSFLDTQGFTPFGVVISGMEHIDELYSSYGDGGSGDGSDGKGPNQYRIVKEGNEYLSKVFPKLSYIITMEHV